MHGFFVDLIGASQGPSGPGEGGVQQGSQTPGDPKGSADDGKRNEVYGVEMDVVVSLLLGKKS